MVSKLEKPLVIRTFSKSLSLDNLFSTKQPNRFFRGRSKPRAARAIKELVVRHLDVFGVVGLLRSVLFFGFEYFHVHSQAEVFLMSLRLVIDHLEDNGHERG
jgi:hypothetical protein